MRSAWKLVLLFCFLAVSFFVSRSQHAYAAHSCTATVSPSSIQANTVEETFNFSITNTGSNPVTYVKVVVPSSHFSLYNYGVPGWSVGANTQQAELTGGSIAPGGTLNFTFRITVGSTEVESQNWTITTWDDVELVNCTGSLGTAITGLADVTPPELSDPTVSSITSTSAVISWTATETSDSKVNYGIGGNLSQTTTGTSNTTQHTVSLTSLTANTTYDYEFCSKDSSNNERCYSGYNFTTGSEGLIVAPTATPTPITTATPTPSATPVPTPTPTPIDRTPPQIQISTQLENPYESAPEITGQASDANGVASIDYSIDGGQNWIPVDEIASPAQQQTEYSFVPFITEDGNYPIQVRALDPRGNIGTSNEITVVIDRLPPLVGSNLISLGPQPLMPNADGTIIALKGLEQKITLSAVGGPTEIDLYIGEKKMPLTFSAETGLWSGFITFEQEGEYTLKTKAIDGANNQTERNLNTIKVLPSGVVFTASNGELITNAKVAVHVLEPQTETWTLWDAKAFGQSNPQQVTYAGEYQFFLPPGTYYMQVESPGFATLKSNIFSVDTSRPINSNFAMKEGRVINIGPFTFPLPVFLQNTVQSNISFSEIDTNTKAANELLNEQIPEFTLNNNDQTFQTSDITSQLSIITFINTWSPPALEQISIISDMFEEKRYPITLISTQETASKVDIFKIRGGYTAPIWADPDGELVELYSLTSLPTHFVIDTRGNIKAVVTKVLSQSELLTLLEEYE